ncbi:MAG: thioredoxin-disulfide reductase [Spirochaetes bacterium]|nr:thioredoxin-disulfide reductase [Spirochaetota bacterium]
MKDLVIIGSGPGGMSAAIYAVRSGMDFIILEKGAHGGQILNTSDVENYPGFIDPVAGYELADKMHDQCVRLGAEFRNTEALSLKKENGIFKIETTDGLIEARSVIAVTGSSNKKLGVQGEAEFTGRGVSYCATCDGAFYRGKTVAAVGGGNAALEEAIFLTRFASKVYLIHRRDKFRADHIVIERVKSNPKIEIIYDTVVEKINGTEKVSSASLLNKKTGLKSELNLDSVFIFIGYNPNNKILPQEILNEWGEAGVDMNMQTAIEGLYAAGDIRSGSKKQILMACADGATAAMSAYEYLSSL